MPRGSGSQRPAAFAAAAGDDRAARPGPHPQPETVDARAASIVRLEGPLALGHGGLSSFCGRPRPAHRRADVTAVVKLRYCPARSRIAPVAAVSPTFGRLFEGTDVATAGQTALVGGFAPAAAGFAIPWLAPPRKPVSFWLNANPKHRFSASAGFTAHRKLNVVMLRDQDDLPCAHLWITMWTVPRRLPISSGVREPKGVGVDR